MAQSHHKKIMQDNRVFLVTNIDVTGTAILDQLVQDQIMSPEQLAKIKETCATNLAKMSAILDHLNMRPQEDWVSFLRCLAVHGHEHVVERLGGQMEPCVNICDLQHLLSKRIMAQHDQIKMWRWHDDHTAVSMEEQYVDLVLVRYKQRTLTREEQPLTDYQQILYQVRSGETFYLTGEPGVGKSTFSMRICVDWANGHGQDRVQKTHEDFKIEDFTFVLPIFLRSVEPDQTLRDVFKETYRLEWEEADVLCNYIRSHQEAVLLILDGLDEFNQKTSQELTDILHKRSLPHVNLFITSRHPSSTVFTEDKKPAIELSLRGFSNEGVTEYVERFYKAKQEDGEALLSKIRESEDLEHLSHYPSVLLMMATLWHFLPAFACTITGFYLDYIRYILCRYEQKFSIPRTSYEEILAAYHENLMRIGELATTAMTNDRVELSFPFDDVIKQIGEETWKLGLLIEETSFLRGRLVVFPHKTLQEFFVSFFIVNSPKSRQRELLISFCGSTRAFNESVMIRRFVVGLGGEELQKQIAILIKGEEMEVAEMQTGLQLEFLAEHQDATLTLPCVVSLNITHAYPASHYVRYIGQDGGKIRKMLLSSRNVRHWRLLQHLHAPNLTCLELAKSEWSWGSVDKQYITQTLDRTLTKFPLKQLSIQGEVYIYVDNSEASAIVSAVIHTHTLHELTFYMTPLTGDSIRMLTEWLPGSYLTSLVTLDCWLTSQEMMAALNVLPPLLQILNVTNNDLTGLTDTGQLSGVTRSQIQILDISQCGLTTRGVLAVIDAAPETLTELNVSHNDWRGKDDDLVRMIERTTRLNKLKTLNLQKLDMSFCNLTPREVLVVIEAAPETLTDLNVSGNYQENGGDDVMWVKERTTQLNKLKTLNLQKLSMACCDLTPQGVLVVIDAAPETLTDLDVSGNCCEEKDDILDALENCGLGEGDELVRVTERTTQLNKLKTLNLEYNNMSGGVITTIKQKLTETCPHLDLRIYWQRS